MRKDHGKASALRTEGFGDFNPNGTQHLKVPSSKASTAPVAVPDPGPSTTDGIIERPPEPMSKEERAASIPLAVPQQEISTTSLLYDLHRKIGLIKTSAGKYFAVIRQARKNPYALAIGSKKLNAIITDIACCKGVTLGKTKLAEINELLEAHAEQFGQPLDVWLRVAPIEGGIEIDLGDDQHYRVRITAGKVVVVESGSDVVFFRTANTKPMAPPATQGDWRLLKKYLNVHATEFILVVAWITYTLAHPKVRASKYVFLIVQGNEGSGKSNLCRVLICLIDPSSVEAQVFPQNAKDLAIAGQNAHVLCFDNLRHLKANMADMLCIAATGGTITSRQLYTDADQQAITLHVAMILNGIHQFIDQPDLAQRCLPIHLTPIDPAQRKSEATFHAEFEADLPIIMRGLFDLIACVFLHLPEVEITNPERMIDFVAWLAGMEKADDVPLGVYQSLYSDTLRQGQLDTLMDNPLAAAIIEFMDALKGNNWSGTPSELLAELCSRKGLDTHFSRDWPQNAIALSKRIAGLQAGLMSQGIRIGLSRGKQRTVTLLKVEA